MGLVDIITDPSLHFVGGCLAIALSYAKSQADRIDFLTNPAFLGVTTLACLTAAISHVVAKQKNVHLTFSEKKLAQWYLMNGAFIHILMDGLSVFRALPGLHDLYYLIDTRYKGDVAVDVVSLFELFVMGPLCLIQYYAVRTKASFRHPLQLVIASIQFMGTIVYLGTGAWLGWKPFQVDYDLTFSAHHIALFWIPVVFGCFLWLVIPPVLIAISMKSLSSMAAASDSNLIPVNAKTFQISSAVFSKGSATGTPFSPLKAKTTDVPVIVASPLAAVEPMITLSPLPQPTVQIDTSVRAMSLAEALEAEAEAVEVPSAAVEATEDVAPAVAVEEVAAETQVDAAQAVEPIVVEEPVAVAVEVVEAETETRRPAARRRSTRRSVAPQY